MGSHYLSLPLQALKKASRDLTQRAERIAHFASHKILGARWAGPSVVDPMKGEPFRGSRIPLSHGRGCMASGAGFQAAHTETAPIFRGKAVFQATESSRLLTDMYR